MGLSSSHASDSRTWTDHSTPRFSRTAATADNLDLGSHGSPDHPWLPLPRDSCHHRNPRRRARNSEVIEVADEGARTEFVEVNGQHVGYVSREGESLAAVWVDVSADGIDQVCFVVNPAKLAPLAAAHGV